ncbi:MAG: hypothetical protein M3Z13_06710, partial [Candidatus Dormibacteraeota bacterium]|nr:hypothetical protein [Candidatus Dormibacteraeota bacterium]
TPTEAGARVVPRKADLKQLLTERRRRLDREGTRRLTAGADSFQRRAERLRTVLPALFDLRRRRLERLRADLRRLSPLEQLARRRAELMERARRLDTQATAAVARRGEDLARRRGSAALLRLLEVRLGRAGTELAHRGDRLAAVSPHAVLARGYSITQDLETAAVLTSAAQTSPSRRIRVLLAAGTLAARVEEVTG